MKKIKEIQMEENKVLQIRISPKIYELLKKEGEKQLQKKKPTTVARDIIIKYYELKKPQDLD